MPELPEVETYVRELVPKLQDRVVRRATVSWPRTVAAPGAAEFVDRIAGQRFMRFGRRGKYMVLGMAGGDTLLVHLRMTGKLLVQPPDTAVAPHTHVVIELEDGGSLHYSDPRKFGRMWLVADVAPVLEKLGPEPLDDGFSPHHLATVLRGRRATTKALLLDQSIVAGVGNIYADEALFAAGINPARPAGTLDQAELQQLCDGVRMVLEKAIAARGSSLGGSRLQNYIRPGGDQGGFQLQHKVFHRTGAACLTCGTPIERTIIAQRSTHFCPNCQR